MNNKDPNITADDADDRTKRRMDQISVWFQELFGFLIEQKVVLFSSDCVTSFRVSTKMSEKINELFIRQSFKSLTEF